MTLHDYRKFCRGCNDAYRRDVAMRRRKAYLAKRHKKEIALALARKNRERCAAS